MANEEGALKLRTPVIRTVVPFVAGMIGTALLRWTGMNFDDAFLEEFVTVVIGGLYYILVRVAGSLWPSTEWLLGSPKPPNYIDVKEVER